MAPMNEDNRAVSAFSSSASALRIRTGFNDTCEKVNSLLDFVLENTLKKLIPMLWMKFYIEIFLNQLNY